QHRPPEKPAQEDVDDHHELHPGQARTGVPVHDPGNSAHHVYEPAHWPPHPPLLVIAIVLVVTAGHLLNDTQNPFPADTHLGDLPHKIIQHRIDQLNPAFGLLRRQLDHLHTFFFHRPPERGFVLPVPEPEGHLFQILFCYFGEDLLQFRRKPLPCLVTHGHKE